MGHPLQVRTQLGDGVASYVRDQITSGRLRAGERVRPEVLAAELGISATPAREALQALRTEGFLELRPGRGFAVAAVTGDDIRDMFLVHAQVSGELAARACKKATAQDLDRLEAIHEGLTAAAAAGDLPGLEEQNHLFHREINLIADSPRLSWVIRLVTRYAPRRFYASIDGWPETTVRDHEGLLAALRSHDARSARRAMEKHVRSAGEQLAEYFESGTADPEPAES